MTTFPTIQTPSIAMPTKVKDPALKSEVVNGMSITRPRYTRILREWSLKWNAMPDTDLTTLLMFFDTVGGGSASFTWSDEFGNSYTVRFDGDIDHESVTDVESAVKIRLAEV